MKKLNTLLLALASILFSSSAFATTHTILVGQSGLTFSPSSLTTVVVGDIIHWEWVSGSHTSTSVSIPSGAATWNNSVFSSATSFDYTVTQAGTYNYQCNPHAGAGMKGSFEASLPTAIMQGAVYSTLVIAPNPSSDEIRVEFNSDKSFTGSVFISDASGNFISEEKVKVKSGDNTLSFNISKYTKGTYIFNLLDGKTALVAKKFVKE